MMKNSKPSVPPPPVASKPKKEAVISAPQQHPPKPAIKPKPFRGSSPPETRRQRTPSPNLGDTIQARREILGELLESKFKVHQNTSPVPSKKKVQVALSDQITNRKVAVNHQLSEDATTSCAHIIRGSQSDSNILNKGTQQSSPVLPHKILARKPLPKHHTRQPPPRPPAPTAPPKVSPPSLPLKTQLVDDDIYEAPDQISVNVLPKGENQDDIYETPMTTNGMTSYDTNEANRDDVYETPISVGEASSNVSTYEAPVSVMNDSTILPLFPPSHKKSYSTSTIDNSSSINNSNSVIVQPIPVYTKHIFRDNYADNVTTSTNESDRVTQHMQSGIVRADRRPVPPPPSSMAPKLNRNKQLPAIPMGADKSAAKVPSVSEGNFEDGSLYEVVKPKTTPPVSLDEPDLPYQEDYVDMSSIVDKEPEGPPLPPRKTPYTKVACLENRPRTQTTPVVMPTVTPVVNMLELTEDEEYMDMSGIPRKNTVPMVTSVSMTTGVNEVEDTEDIYEQMDLSRPVPPPRRKKLKKLPPAKVKFGGTRTKLSSSQSLDSVLADDDNYVVMHRR